jgi:hypothetical protein
MSLRRSAAVLMSFAVVAIGTFAAQAASTDSVWVQYAADGAPHVRAIVRDGVCPSLMVGAQTTQLTVRSAPQSGFSDTVCDLVLPANAAGARVNGTVLPPIPVAPQTIALFGDTGCRLKGAEVQACDDPAQWPFPTIARDIAAAHPDLVIHVGDYYYRESPCPAGVDCTGSPHGDNAASWNADWFTPMAPLFAVAPIVNVRGNHEDCKRSPLGWTRYLSGVAAVGCLDHEPVAFVSFANLLVAEVDDATETTEALPEPAVFESDEAQVDARAAAAGHDTWLIVHRPPVAYEATHENAPNAGAHVAAIISGHIHTFAGYSLPGEPPQAVVGMGGDNLAAAKELEQFAPFGGVTDPRFGYAIFQRRGDGWDIIVHDISTAVHRRCRLQARAITCGPALTTSG